MSTENPQGSMAKRLVELAHQTFRFGQSKEREPFAVPLRGPNVALRISTSEHDGFRRQLAHALHVASRTVASKQSLTDALQVLLADCAEATPEPVYRRVAPGPDGGIVVDLGTTDGKAVTIAPGHPWQVVERSPAVFQRTQLTGVMPEPTGGGSLEEIPRLLGLSDRHWNLVLGWLLAAYDRDIPHPILAIFGPAGAGKSFLAKLLVRLCDPSPCPLRSAPNSEEDWHVSAASSWVYAIDNVSDMKAWLADALCKAATGDARVCRKRYSDTELSVVQVKLPVILTSIEPGRLRGDFGDRLVMLELPKRNHIKSERELERIISDRLPAWHGAIFDAWSKTQSARPHMKTSGPTARMEDYRLLLRAADIAGVTVDCTKAYMENRRDAAQEVGEGDELVEALTRLLQKSADHRWQGIATDLLSDLNAVVGKERPAEWPKAANVLSRRLRRLEPVLQDCGVRYESAKETDRRRRVIYLSLSKSEETSPESFATEEEGPFPADLANFSPNDTSPLPERSPNDVEVPPAPLPDDLRTIPERSLQDRRMTADRDRSPPRVNPIAASLDAFGTCRKCGSRQVVDKPIHSGKSLRRECGDCQAFIAFTKWAP